MTSSGPHRRGTGVGVLVGIIGTILVLALIAGVAMMAMGKCPMCGNSMDHGQTPMMQDGSVMNDSE